MKIIKKIKYPLTIILFIIIVILAFILKNKLQETKYENVSSEIEENSIDINNNESIIDEKECYIDIKGAIKKPGVYKTSCKSKVQDIINLSGGLTEQADTSVINLAKKIEDEMVIIIYTKEEVKNSNVVNTVVKVVEQECNCPSIKNDGCINTEIDELINNNKLININTASLEKLQELPGIGESKAKIIIEHREKNGNFKSPEDLKDVSGIGEKTYEQIKIYITT